ncbi:zinc-dependent peptidase [Spectribacter hydrogenooxidans]|uniref:Zinc-dependent peptidase n=1 Tax=Spectribacter hydrogenoxidans TaxID=3075608 RepID=A0ABU3BZ17_9GAMM|nr:zinc-dependent peptidase [Salinisphaera sp. W335]MDT0634505.1 zinc-dependent peptidase [Salinisphaera sp. W335]
MNGALVFIAAGAGLAALGVVLFFAPVLIARRRHGPGIDSERLAATVGAFPRLTTAEQRRLATQVRGFLRHKRFTASGQAVPDIIRLAVAGNACLLRLGKDADCFPDVREIALEGGDDPPSRVGLAWTAVEDAMSRSPANPVIRAFAARLADQRTAHPRNRCAAEYPEKWWRQFNALATDRAAREALPALAGAETPDALFLDTSEMFFQSPDVLANAHNPLYRLMTEFYGVTLNRTG